jgi:hypothetical protein
MLSRFVGIERCLDAVNEADDTATTSSTAHAVDAAVAGLIAAGISVTTIRAVR